MTDTLQTTPDDAAASTARDPADDKAEARGVSQFTDLWLEATTWAADQGWPAALVTKREEAWQRFEAHGVPSSRLEEFRRTPLARALGDAQFVAAHPTSVDPALLKDLALPVPHHRIVVTDGRLQEDATVLDGLESGIRVAGLADALAGAHGDDLRDRVAEHLGQVVAGDAPASAMHALNLATFTDGVVVHVPANVQLTKPLHLVHLVRDALSTADSAAATPSVQTRVLVLMDTHAEATVVETHAPAPVPEATGAPATHGTHTNPVTEGILGQGAQLSHLKLQIDSDAVVHTGAVGFQQDRDAEVRDLSFSLGARMARHDVATELAEGATGILDGVFLATGTQHVDHHTTIRHAAPHGTSRETYKGIIDGKAMGVFVGNVQVDTDAQQTDSEQENRNLLLSDKAHVDTTPVLVINADDVKCSHGSTIGQLDSDALFYMRARGVGVEEARLILTQAFAAEALDHVRDLELRSWLNTQVRSWFTTGRHRTATA